MCLHFDNSKCVCPYPPCKLCKLLLTHLLCCVFKLVVTACRRLPQSLLLVEKNNASVKWNFYGGVCCLIGWICASVQGGCDESKNLKPCSPRCVFFFFFVNEENAKLANFSMHFGVKKNLPYKQKIDQTKHELVLHKA